MDTLEYAVKDFSQGMTDNYIDGDPRFCQQADNGIITDNRKCYTRPGSQIQDSTLYQIPAGNQRIGNLTSYSDEFFMQSARNVYWRNVTWQTITGPTGNPVFNTGSTSERVSRDYWNGHIFYTNDAPARPMRVFKTGSSWFVQNAGLPRVAALAAPTFTAGTDNYIYAFIHTVTYVSQGVTFKLYSAVTEYFLENTNPPNTNPVTFTIPVLANGGTNNYDTVTAKIEIYRTETNSTTFYKIGEVTNGTTAYADTASDASIIDNELLYTTGGEVEREEAPESKYLTIVDDIAYYANCKDGSEQITNRVRQSIPGFIGSSPSDFYVDLDDEITGISRFNSIPIVFCKNRVYRLEGTYDELGRGGIAKVDISTTIGCILNDSIVSTEYGIFFWSNDGIYHTDGRSVRKISTHLSKVTYKGLTDTATKKRNINGCYNPDLLTVYWGAQENTSSLDADIILTLNITYGITDQSSFLRWRAENGSFGPTALAIHNRELIRADKRGYTFVHRDTIYNDPKVNTAAIPSLWNTQPVIFDYKSCAFDFQLPGVRKWVGSVLVTAENETNINIQVNSNNDDSGFFNELKVIRYRENIVWGTPEVEWGDPEIYWNYNGMIEEQRRMPAGGLRCSYKQIQITNAHANIVNSDALGLGTVNNSSKTVLLQNYPTMSWSSEYVDYYISFEDDDYENEYLITARTASTITYSDTANTSPNGSKKWEIKGVAKNEIIQLLGYVVYYSPMSRTQKAFNGQVGANA